MRAKVGSANTRLHKGPLRSSIGGVEIEEPRSSVNSEEGVIIPIQCYLLENMVRVRDAPRTIEKQGYALNQWYDYLKSRNISLFDANEHVLQEFLLNGGRREDKVRVLSLPADAGTTATSLYKLDTIIGFYDFWANKRGRELRNFRGTTLSDIKETLLQRPRRSLAKAAENFGRPRSLKLKTRRGTPSSNEFERVLFRTLDQKNNTLAQTYYLALSLARFSGSRAVGIFGLHVSNLLLGLRSEPEFRKIDGYAAVLENHLLPKNRALIVQTLQVMQESNRRFVYCEVLNKGRNWTTLPIPIELCVELIDYICTVRKKFVEERFLAKGRTAPPNVFLSHKNRALSQEAISNFFNKIFKEEEINATFHKLRAAFSQDVVRELYIRERAVNGSAWQVSNVLELARNLVGHKGTESLQPYLDGIQAQEMLFGQQPVMVSAAEDAGWIRAIAAQLDNDQSSAFRETLRIFLQKQDIEPISADERRYSLF